MVVYDPMREAWKDDSDPSFSVSMTPVGGVEDREFAS